MLQQGVQPSSDHAPKLRILLEYFQDLGVFLVLLVHALRSADAPVTGFNPTGG
jgi:hypothetical protein